MKVLFLGLSEYAVKEMIDNGVDVDYLKKLSQHEGEICEAQLSIGTSENWEDNYYDLLFSDGFKFYECSGYHLEEVID